MDAFERRLRSIYEAFDARNPKVETCNALLVIVAFCFVECPARSAVLLTHDFHCTQAAVKLATAALQKHKDSQILRVLKGLALQRMDRAKEAFEVRATYLSLLSGSESRFFDQIIHTCIATYSL